LFDNKVDGFDAAGRMHAKKSVDRPVKSFHRRAVSVKFA